MRLAGGVTAVNVGSAGVQVSQGVMTPAQILGTDVGMDVRSAAFIKFGSAWFPYQQLVASTLLASAARTTTQVTANITPVFVTRVAIILNVSVASGTGGLTLSIEGIDPVSGNPYTTMIDAAPIIATGVYVFELGPGMSTAGVAGANNVRMRAAGNVPITSRVKIAVGDASSYTYSVGMFQET